MSGTLVAGAARPFRTGLGRAASVAGGIALAGHGLIHLMGVALLWRLGQTGELRYADAQPAAGSVGGILVGGLWFVATVLFLAAAVLLLAGSARWLAFGFAAALISLPALLLMATATGAGLAADGAVLVAGTLLWRAGRAGRAGRPRRSGGRQASANPVPAEAKEVREAWLNLAAGPESTERSGTELSGIELSGIELSGIELLRTEVFSAELVAHLPEPARRWLTHAIPAGTSMWSTVQVTMRGKIKLGAWRRFTATQVVAPAAGYIWAATAWLAVLPVRGFDRFSSGTGEMRWRLLGVIPVVTAVGADVTRSAAGRLVSEIVLAPTGFRAATWTAGRSADHVIGTWHLDGVEESVELHIGPDGQVRSALVSRWGNPGGSPFGRYPFGCTVLSEQAFAGVTIPATVSAGWWWGTARQDEGEFFRATITGVSGR